MWPMSILGKISTTERLLFFELIKKKHRRLWVNSLSLSLFLSLFLSLNIPMSKECLLSFIVIQKQIYQSRSVNYVFKKVRKTWAQIP